MRRGDKQEAQRATYRAPEYNVPHLLPHLGFLIGSKNTNLVADIEILLPIKFHQIQFSGFREALRQTRAPRGTDRSPEYNEHFCYKLDSRVKNLISNHDYRMEPKTTTLHDTCFLIIAMNWVCCCSLPVWRRSFLKKGTPLPVTYFSSPWIRPWANMAKTSFCMCRAMNTSSLPSFVNIHSAVL